MTLDLYFVPCGQELNGNDNVIQYDSLVTLPNSANTCKVNNTCFKKNISEKDIVIVEPVGAKSVVVSLFIKRFYRYAGMLDSAEGI